MNNMLVMLDLVCEKDQIGNVGVENFQLSEQCLTNP